MPTYSTPALVYACIKETPQNKRSIGEALHLSANPQYSHIPRCTSTYTEQTELPNGTRRSTPPKWTLTRGLPVACTPRAAGETSPPFAPPSARERAPPADQRASSRSNALEVKRHLAWPSLEQRALMAYPSAKPLGNGTPAQQARKFSRSA